MSQENTNTDNILYSQAKNIPYLEDHNNIFRSDGIFSPDIQKEYFGDKKSFWELDAWKKQRFFEKILADFFTRAIDPSKIQDPKIIEKMEEDYEIFLKMIIGKHISDYSKLESFYIQKWFLHLKLNGATRIINLVSQQVGNEDIRKRKLQEEIHKQTETLREKISTESYMWGSLIVTYENLSDFKKEAIASVWVAWWLAYASTGVLQVASGVIREGNRITETILTRVKRIGFRNQFWKMEFITPSDDSSLNQSNQKGNHEKNIVAELQNQGIVINVPGKSFWRASLLALSKTKLSILNFSYENFLKESGQTDTREARKAFLEWKNSCILDIDNIEKAYQVSPVKWRSFLSKFLLQWTWERNIANISGKIVGSSMHWMFWPIFFRKYHENAQDGAMLYASIAEVGLFTVWARIWSMTPGVFKPIAGVLAGWTMVLGWEHFGWAVGLDKKWWKYYPDREDESYKETWEDGKSLLANIVTMGELYGLSDKTNTDLRIGKREGWDIRIPQWVNKIPGMEWARDVTVPHIDILRKTIDVNTPPWEWMWKTISRDKESWNKEVDIYIETLLRDIYSFIGQYKKWEWIFRDSNIQRQKKSQESIEDAKLRIFKSRLESLFPNGWSERAHNFYIKNQIIDYTVQLLREKDSNIDSSLGFFVKSALHAGMHLDNQTLVNQAKIVRSNRSEILTLDEKKNPNGWILFEFSQEFSDPILHQYVLSLFERIRNKKRLVNISLLDNIENKKGIIEKTPNWYWIETPEFLWQKWKKWVNTKEWLMFQQLIDSKTIVTSPVLKILFWENATQWDVFYNILNIMVENKRQEEFVRNIIGNWYANKWKMF